MSAYTRELVEQLLPTLWNDASAFGMTDPRAADPDMPKGSSDPSKGGALYAHLADIKAAWAHTYLTVDERRALLLRYGAGWAEREIGSYLGVAQQTISDRVVRGVGRLMEYLNGHEPAGP